MLSLVVRLSLNLTSLPVIPRYRVIGDAESCVDYWSFVDDYNWHCSACLEPCYYNAWKVCLFVCLASGIFCVAWSWSPTTACESLGRRYMRPHLAPHGPPEGVELLGIRVDPLIGRDFSSRLIVCTVDLCTFCFVSHCFLNDFWLPLDAANFVNLQAYWFNLCIIQDNAGSDQMM